jgi:hypothetical protein
MSYGEWPQLFVDHINQSKSDNRICNLRQANRSENLFNHGKNKNNTSGVKGVTFCKRDNKWRAQIRIDSKTFNLGRFITKKEAAEAYIKRAKQHRGEFATC